MVLPAATATEAASRALQRVMQQQSTTMTTVLQTAPLWSKVGSYERAAGTILHPSLWATGFKRQQHHLRDLSLTQWQESSRNARLVAHWRRIQRNVSRLHARRWLEMALVSLAAYQFRKACSLEEEAAEQPLDWKNWSKKDWADELMESLGSTRWARWWTAVQRLVHLTALATPLVLLAPLSYVSETAHAYSWSYALWGLEQAGPTFVKWVQWATTRQDLFSPEFCQYFGKLRDDTSGHAWPLTQQILQEDLGISASDNDDSDQQQQYLQLEKVPIGSGCIAQVYRGTLTQAVGQFPAGTRLAVKVQHPDILQKVCVDFYLLGKVAQFLEDYVPYLNLRYMALADTVRQFRDIMLPQLDLTLEAKHLQRFNRDFASDARVHFPQPLEPLTTKRVLTETFLPGRPILEYTQRSEAVRKELAALGVETTLRMIFLHDFLHGDLHPGNILVHEKEKGGPLHLHLLDCGLVVEMGPWQHVNLTKIMGAFSRREGRLAGQLMVDTSSDCQASEADMELFVQGISLICNEDSNFIEHVADKITDICYLACRHKVKLEPAFISAALAVEIIEGIAKSLYHDIPVSSTALRFIFQAELMHNMPAIKLW